MLNIEYKNSSGSVEKELLYRFLTKALHGSQDEGHIENIETQLGHHRRALASLLELMAKKNLLSATELTGIVSTYAPLARLITEPPEGKKEFDKKYPPCE